MRVMAALSSSTGRNKTVETLALRRTPLVAGSYRGWRPRRRQSRSKLEPDDDLDDARAARRAAYRDAGAAPCRRTNLAEGARRPEARTRICKVHIIEEVVKL